MVSNIRYSSRHCNTNNQINFCKKSILPASATGTIALCDSASGPSTTSITVVNDTVDFSLHLFL